MTGTIAALSSAPGTAPEAILRLSGPLAFGLVDPHFTPDAGQEWPLPGAGAASGGLELPGAGPPVPVSLYRMVAPRSFTGDDVIEIHLPGNPLLAHRLLGALLEAGAEPAGPGAFTRRAVENGRLDMAQAEAISGLIGARSDAEARAALAGVSGALSAHVEALRASLLDISGLIEASLDFADRGIGEDLEKQALELVRALCAELETMDGPDHGQAADHDLPQVLLYGPTNAGKSTLFNALIGRDRAAVSPTAGTTRDPVSATVDVAGSPCVLIDPAGVGDPATSLEGRAQHRARDLVGAVDLVLLVTPCGARPSVPPEDPAVPVLRISSKSDLGQPPADLPVSAHTGEGLAAVRQRIAELITGPRVRASRYLLTTRQQAALRRARTAVDKARSLLAEGHPSELAAFEIGVARGALADVTGALLSDEILGRIFSRFCIGK